MGSWKVAAFLLGMVTSTLMGATLFHGTKVRASPSFQAPEASELAPLRRAEGRVVNVDAEGRHIYVRMNQAIQAFLVDTTTTIFLEGRTGEIEDLKPGQVVTASYDVDGEVPVAQWIEVDSTRAANSVQ
jgi:hypothetical protein